MKSSFWLEQNRIDLKGLFQVPETDHLSKTASLINLQKTFGYSLEEVEKIILAMAENAQEPISSMGDDESLAVLEKEELTALVSPTNKIKLNTKTKRFFIFI